MPKKLTDCVKKVKDKGMPESSAWPICISSTGLKPHKKTKKSIDDYVSDYITKGEKIEGGLADNKLDSKYDSKQLEMGIKVEMEHTNDPKKAKEIAKDHLEEIPDYYTRLKEMEDKAKKSRDKTGPHGKGLGPGKGTAECRVKKSLDDMISDLCKAQVIHHKDSNTYTDMDSMSLAKLSTPESYQSYIMGYVKDLDVGNTIPVPLRDNKTLKIYKVEDGVYSGHIQEEDGTISHNIERATVPEIVSHLVAKEEQPISEGIITTPKEEEKKEQPSSVVININLGKSEGDSMDKLDEKINDLLKAKEEDIKEEDIKEEEKEEDKEEKEIEPEKDNGKDKKKFITEIIKMLKQHHIQENPENVRDLSKFLVHLHKETKPQEETQEEVKKSMDSEEKEKIIKNMKKKTIKEVNEMPELNKKCKKSFDDMIVEFLTKGKGGEGSRGGKIIGHTKSGKPIYAAYDQSTIEAHKHLSPEEHKEAAEIHNEVAEEHRKIVETIANRHKKMTDEQKKKAKENPNSQYNREKEAKMRAAKKFMEHGNKADKHRDFYEASIKKSEEKLEKKGTIKKSKISEIIDELNKAEPIRLNKEENKQIFERDLKDIVKYAYWYCKDKHGQMSLKDILEKIKESVNERVIDRMRWDEKFLLAKRSVGYDDKYLDKFIKDYDFEELDKKYAQMKEAQQPEIMAYSKEGYKVFAQAESASKSVLETLEKGNNFFNKELEESKLYCSFREVDYDLKKKAK